MKHLIFALALITSPAMAADLYVAPAEAQPVESFNWTGLSVGAYGGFENTSSEVSFTGIGSADGVGAEGFIGGARVGYDYQLGDSFVVGVVGQIGFSGVETTFTIPGAPFALDAGPDWDASIVATLGFLPTERVKVYALGGYTRLQNYTVNITGGGPAFSISTDYDGWTAGAGIEAMVTDRISFGVEGRYNQYGGETWTVPGLNVEPSGVSAEAFVGFRF